MSNASQLQVDIPFPKESRPIKMVENLKYKIRWPDGHINHYLQTVIHKRLRKQPGILSVLFSNINEDILRIDYDPEIISNLEIILILKYFNLDIVNPEAC